MSQAYSDVAQIFRELKQLESLGEDFDAPLNIFLCGLVNGVEELSTVGLKEKKLVINKED